MAMNRSADFTESTAEMVATGIDMIETVRGPAYVREVQGVSCMSYDVEGRPTSILMLTYGDGDFNPMLGMFAQLDANGARQLAASLLRLADRLQPVAKN